MFPLLDPAGAPRIRGRVHFERVAVRKSASFLDEWVRACRAALHEAKRKQFGPGSERLFDLAARTEWLPLVAPSGRAGSDFVARCRKAAALWSASLVVERAFLRIGEALDRRAGRSSSGEPLALEQVAGLLSAKEHARLRAFAGRYAGEAEEGLRRGEVSIPGTRALVGKSGALRGRAELLGSRIGVGPALAGNSTRIRIAGRALLPERKRASRKLARALALLDAAWPHGGREVRRRTRLILTLAEPGLVSYSHLHRPGVTYINLRGKSLFDLADDLLHETAHHRLHAVEDHKPLVRARQDDADRYWSPWRRSLRPVRGIIHAAYTFSFRAELLGRMWAAARNHGGRIGPAQASSARIAWLRREATAERRHLKQALSSLKDASGKGLLTERGRTLVGAIESCLNRRKTKARA